MQTERAIRILPAIRNKLMLACAVVVACALAAPAASAHGHRYPGHRDNSGKVLGALVVGAVIGGVLASSSHQGGYYYPAQAYPPPTYYGGYPTYGYGGYAYPAYGYGGGVSVGVVYSNHGYRYDNRARRYYYRDRGHQGHYYRHYDNRRGWQGRDYHRRGH